MSEKYLKEIEYVGSEDGFSEGNSTLKDYEGNLKNFQIDEFRIHNYDRDPRMEGIFADNTEKGSFVAFYPFGEADGEEYDQIVFLPGEEVVEIREGYLDNDERKEFGLFTDKNAYLADWDASNQDVKFKKYSAPDGQEITDGQIFYGNPIIATNSRVKAKDIEFKFYKLGNGSWKPFFSEGFIKGMVEKLRLKNPVINSPPIHLFIPKLCWWRTSMVMVKQNY